MQNILSFILLHVMYNYYTFMVPVAFVYNMVKGHYVYMYK